MFGAFPPVSTQLFAGCSTKCTITNTLGYNIEMYLACTCYFTCLRVVRPRAYPTFRFLVCGIHRGGDPEDTTLSIPCEEVTFFG